MLTGHPQQERMPAVMILIMTFVVGVLQSLLEVVVLLFGLAEQLVLKLLSVWNHEGVVTSCSGLCGFWKFGKL